MKYFVLLVALFVASSAEAGPCPGGVCQLKERTVHRERTVQRGIRHFFSRIISRCN